MQDVNILLVEDEKKIAESLSKGLSEEHFHVDIAFDGVAGRNLFMERRYDLAIVDINLPLLNGYDLCSYILSVDEDMRIIMVLERGNDPFYRELANESGEWRGEPGRGINFFNGERIPSVGIFFRNKNKMLSRIDIAKEVWDIDFDTKTNVIGVYVNFLRRKIDRNFSPKLIHTHIGMGYIFREP